ncbi:MAG: FIST C-terminal domain-containing protein [Myxococcales bacterium]|nr:FIST C-terminal domain-containing protein [Myxococcales bacterium]
MLRVVVGQAEGLETEEVVAAVISQCERQLEGVAPRAGIVIVAGAFEPSRVAAAIRERWPALALIGCGSSGVMSSAQGYSQDAIGLTLLASDTIAMRAGLGRACSLDPADAVQRALTEARAGAGAQERVCIALTDPLRTSSTEVLSALSGQAADGCVLFGGAAGAPWGIGATGPVQIFGDEVVSDAIVVLLLSGPVEVAHCVENSWSPVGEPQEVTKATGELVERIGERTALDFYQYYLGPHSRPAIEFPLAVFEERDAGRYYLRVPKSYDASTGAVRYAGVIPEGARVQLTEAVRDKMLVQTGRSIRAAAQQLDAAPAAALVFSCAIRSQILGTKAAAEVDVVVESLPRVPLLGFYALGEIAPLLARTCSTMHNATLVAVLLREAGAPASSPTPEAPAPPAQVAPPVLSAALLRRKLERAEQQRARLEEYRDLNNAMLRTIGAEIERSRQQIAAQNAELRQLNDALAREKQRSEELLLNILPREVAQELKRTGHVQPVYYESVTVLFTDFKGFTRISSQLSPRALIDELDYFFSAFDELVARRGLEKLKTIGDAYMAAGGIPIANESHALDAVQTAWDIQAFMAEEARRRARSGRPRWELRVGINTGPLMAGVIGHRKFAYDIWGDTVNIAARLESAGEAGRINLSRATYERVAGSFRCTSRGLLPVKNADPVDMYFVDGPRAPAHAARLEER